MITIKMMLMVVATFIVLSMKPLFWVGDVKYEFHLLAVIDVMNVKYEWCRVRVSPARSGWCQELWVSSIATSVLSRRPEAGERGSWCADAVGVTILMIIIMRMKMMMMIIMIIIVIMMTNIIMLIPWWKLCNHDNDWWWWRCRIWFWWKL